MRERSSPHKGNMSPRQRIINKNLSPYFLLLPACVVLIGLTIYPCLYSLYLSFHTWGGGINKPFFVGLGNYEEIFRSYEFWNALRLSGIWTGVTVVVEFLIGFAVALLLAIEVRGRKIYRVLVMIPMVMTPIVSALTWKTLIYHPSVGIANYILSIIFLPGQAWLGENSTALLSIVVYDFWHWTPFITLCLLAGLSALPVEPYDAARVDGASKWQIFVHLTLPLMNKVILVTLLFRMIDAFRTFDVIFAMTGGGPGRATQTLPLYIFQTGLEFFYFGKGAAISMITVVIIVLLASPEIKLFHRKT